MAQTLTATGRPAARGPVALERTGAGRSAGIDRLRVGLTILVIAHHAGQAYGPTGGDWPVFEAQRAAILGPFFAVNAAFFMGLFFLLAGLFTPAAIDRKGVWPFFAGRLLRLGLPLLVVALLLFPTLAYLEGDRSEGYLGFLLRSPFTTELEFAHLWFVLHLLIYGGLYALWRVAGGRRVEERFAALAAPGHAAIVAYTLALALATFLVRIWYPIDAWPRLFGLIPAELAHLPQYASLFVVGLLAGRAGWLTGLSNRVGKTWLGIGLLAAALRYAYAFGGHNLVAGGLIAGGGADWRSLVWSAWEALICVGLCVGLLWTARGARDTQTRLGRVLAASAYGAYIVHVFVVVGLNTLLLPLPLAPLAKFALVTLIATPVSFALAALPLWRPGARAARRYSSAQ